MIHSKALTPEIEQQIIAFVEQWAVNNPRFNVKIARAHISRDNSGQPRAKGLGIFEVCLDMPGWENIRNTAVIMNESGNFAIDESHGGDYGCAICLDGKKRSFFI
jgi:hypothetical protein